MAHAKRSKFTTIDAFFVIMNKSCIPAIVPEQSESASFVMLVEIHNVDVPAALVPLVTKTLLYCHPSLPL